MASTLLSPEEAGRVGSIMSDYGEVPMFTNRPEMADEPNAVYANLNSRPTDDDMDFTEKMHKFVTEFEKNLPDPNIEAQNAYNSFLRSNRPNVPFADEKQLDPRLEKEANFIAMQTFQDASQRRQGVLQVAMDKFKEDYAGMSGKGYSQAGITSQGKQVRFNKSTGITEVINPDGTATRWNEETDGKIKNPMSNASAPNKSFAEWGEKEKEQEIKNYIVSGSNTKNFSARDAKSQNEFREELTKYQIAKGLDENALRAIKAEGNSLETSLKKQQQNRDMAESFVGNIGGQLSEIEKLYKEIDRTGTRIANVPIRAIATQIKGSGKEQALASYLMEVSREIGKLSTGSQASIAELSVETQAKWDKIHDGTLPWKEIKDVLDATRKQSEIRLGSMDEALKKTQGKFDGLIDKYAKNKTGEKKYNPADVVKRGTRGTKRVVQLKDGSIVDE